MALALFKSKRRFFCYQFKVLGYVVNLTQKMKTHLFLTLFLFSLLCSCGLTKSKVRFDEAPPNGKYVGENYYCDETEITNYNWLEYMFWTERTFGVNSPESLATLPDTNVWKKEDSCLHTYASHYLRHPAYRDYPVVGVSQAQAVSFSKWRSDRVFEYLLIREGIIDFDTLQGPNDHFTIERYLNGEYNGYTPDASVKAYPYFRLPTSAEFVALDNRNFGGTVDAYSDCKKSKKCKDCLEHNGIDHSGKRPCTGSVSYLTVPVRSSCYTPYLFHLNGNVSEWLSEENKIGGNSWRTIAPEGGAIQSIRVSKASGPSDFIGFRNVFEWKPITRN